MDLYVILQAKYANMSKNILTIIILAVLLLTSCAHEFNQVYKSQDTNYKYEYAKEAFANGKYTQAATLLEGLIMPMKGTDNAEECLYMLGMSHFNSKDYESAAQSFKTYYKTYPKGIYAEHASYYIGESLFQSTPEPRLDQTETVNAISAFQDYLDIFHDAKMKDKAQQRLLQLQDKLIKKELYSAQLYYNLGTYFGNCTSGGSNYEACIITAQNAIKDYPYSKEREDFALLIMKSKFELAQQSVEEKKLDRFRDAEDECYGFINEYPESKNKSLAEKFIASCKKVTNEK